MATIIEHKPHNVTIGVLDKTMQLYEDLQSVTFADVLGTLHTVFAHTEGPFQTPEDIVKAFEQGILHTAKSHEAAAALATDRGDTALAARLSKVTDQQSSPQPFVQGVVG